VEFKDLTPKMSVEASALMVAITCAWEMGTSNFYAEGVYWHAAPEISATIQRTTFAAMALLPKSREPSNAEVPLALVQLPNVVGTIALMPIHKFARTILPETYWSVPSAISERPSALATLPRVPFATIETTSLAVSQEVLIPELFVPSEITFAVLDSPLNRPPSLLLL